MNKLPHLVYLHGFLSSPASQKARETAAWLTGLGLGDHFHCPELPPSPGAVTDRLRALSADLADKPVCCIGSSLGGFYATWAAEEFGWRAVLINPVVQPGALVQDYLGPQHNYQTGRIETIEARYAEELRALERPPRHLAQYWLLVQTGDATLDYREAVGFYAGVRQTLIEGGDHSFAGYADWLPRIWQFAQGE